MTPYKFTFLLLTIIIGSLITGFAPAHNKIQLPLRVTTIDSVLFSPNAEAGWTILSFYLHQENSDTVDFELILQHSNNINWANEQWIGTITGSNYIPVSEQYAAYSLLPGDNWNMHIATDGKCFFNLINGSLPSRDPIVIPIKVRYKNK